MEGFSINDKNSFLDFVASELMISNTEIDFETEFRKIPTWSSLNALIFISRINEDLDVLISSSDLASIKTIDEIYNLIVRKMHGAS